MGDDLIVTNVKRVQNAIGRQACSALLLEINQIGTIPEAIDAVNVSGAVQIHRDGPLRRSGLWQAIGRLRDLPLALARSRSDFLEMRNTHFINGIVKEHLINFKDLVDYHT